jgi:hypothetical protein
MITIDQEANQRKESPLNIDSFRETYVTTNDLYIFSSPALWTLDKNLFFLISNSDEILFELKYKYRPDYLSFDKYGTIMLWEMLMYINGVMSLEEFNLDTVLIPHYSAITTILQDRFIKKDINKLRKINW